MALPEVNVNKCELVDTARQALAIAAQIADLETQLKECKKKMIGSAVIERLAALDKSRYIGLVRVTAEDMPASRVEFKTCAAAALAVEQEDVLDGFLGAARPLVFSRTQVITEITDPEQVVTELKKAGKNPWDFLSLSVKSGMDGVVAAHTEGVISAECFLPTKDWLASLNNIVHTLSEGAKKFIAEYLLKALTPSVVLGSKGRAS
jgi:hypothetical protein